MAIELNTFARPYAKAAFEFARDAKDIPMWRHFLQHASLITQDQQVKDLLKDPAVSVERRTEFYSGLLQASLNEYRLNFLKLLSSADRLIVLPQIEALFADYQADYENTMEIIAISFRSITPQQKDAIAEKMEKRLGRKVTVTTEIDPTILGGLIIRAGDLVIDGSTRTRLEKLREQLVV